ncbi:MAG: CARDB domain-containing protein [Minisyncoccia bacterium]
MNEQENAARNRAVIVNTLAVAGFIALIGASMWLAVYATRFVPGVVTRVGTAAVYLGSVFTPAPKPSLSVVPTASTTIPFGEASSTVPTSGISLPQTLSKTIPTTAGKQTSSTIQIGGATTTPKTSPTLSGLPDFVVTINAVGYLATSSAESFVASSTVPKGSRPAVNFTIKNIGTNTTGSWRFNASIPAQNTYVYQSQPQQSLAPGDSIDYALGFDQANGGVQTISITANFDKAVGESNSDNNSASAKITIIGS